MPSVCVCAGSAKKAKRLHSLLCTGQNATETYSSINDGFFLKIIDFFKKKIYRYTLLLSKRFCFTALELWQLLACCKEVEFMCVFINLDLNESDQIKWFIWHTNKPEKMCSVN